MKQDKTISICFYDLLYKEIYDSSPQREITFKKAGEIISRNHNVPSKLKVVILKEMEHLGWIGKANVYTITLKKKPVDLDNTSKLFRSVGLW